MTLSRPSPSSRSRTPVPVHTPELQRERSEERRAESSEQRVQRETRRTEGVRNQGRAARVVSDVLRSTAEQLSRVGFAALRVDDVATLSGVNKTTIYRRWPTRSDLVAATLRALKPGALPDTGSLREDVLAWFRQLVDFAGSPVGAGIIRMIQTEKANPELEPIARALRDEHQALREGVIERAIQRGELPPVADHRVYVDLVFSSISTRFITFGERVDEAYVEQILDIVTRRNDRPHALRAQS